MASGRAIRREGNVIHLAYEDFVMIKKEIIERNPLIQLGFSDEYILREGTLGAVLAHAGVGKTARMVQMALHAMMHEHTVLHVSLNDAVSKVDLWYRELYHDITRKFDAGEIREYWEQILAFRFIMTFKVEGFSAPKLEERLTDLMQHVADLFHVLVQLSARGPEVYIKAIKGQSPNAKIEALNLDPATMLIK
jgi:hypothetical protein